MIENLTNLINNPDLSKINQFFFQKFDNEKFNFKTLNKFFVDEEIFFWSPHIDPQVATVKSVINSLKSLSKYQKNLNLSLLNVFGEWNEFVIKDVNIIKISSNEKLINQKFKRFFKFKNFIFQNII